MLLWLSLLLCVGAWVIVDASYLPPCDSDIYCHGDLLHTVQMARLFNDSKHFVDMKLRFSPNMVKNNFRSMMSRTANSPTTDEVRSFVDNNFEDPSKEFVPWIPSDWKAEPAFLANISDSNLRSFARDLNSLWKDLGRKMSSDVLERPEYHSLVFVPNPTIVPGGRFREFYYWDSYWVIQGLLLSEMADTVRGMLENFLFMVKKYGFVPNGGRVYFTRRSQPPFLIPMVKEYLDATGDLDFLRANIDGLEREFEFWRRSRSVMVERDGTLHSLAIYNVSVGKPRPESYSEDLKLAQAHFHSRQDKEDLFAEIQVACETGWDFSSRWFASPGNIQSQGPGDLADVKPRSIIPVDLNSILCRNAYLLEEFYRSLGMTSQAAQYRHHATSLEAAINAVLWDEETGSWYDYDHKNKNLRKNFYASNIFPIWAGCSTPQQNLKFLDYLLEDSHALRYKGGVPTTLAKSGQQWDFPNAWPPLQNIIVTSLLKINDSRAHKVAYDIAKKWIDTNYLSYKQSSPHAMFEKYDVTMMGLPGGGGEYDVQLGFGWSNGVVMKFLDMFGDQMTVSAAASPVSSLLITAISSVLLITGSVTGWLW